MNDLKSKAVSIIKELRQSKSISQEHIAKCLNLTTTAYNRIENNKTQVTLNSLAIIAKALNEELNTILGLPLSNNATNNQNVIMSQYNNGTLQISITAKDFKDLSNNFKK